jgi:hypothetical protein
LPDVRLTVSHDRRNKEFRGQMGDDEFLSLNLSFPN